MNCREFEREIADYVAGRLSPVDANRMLAHADACASCRALEQEERTLRQRFTEAPEVTLPTDLWAKLAPQLQERPVRRARWSWRWSWPLPPRMVLAPVASLAVVAGISLWFTGRSVSIVPVVETDASGAGPHRVVNHVDEIRNMGMPETELLLEQTLSARQMGLAALTEGESL